MNSDYDNFDSYESGPFSASGLSGLLIPVKNEFYVILVDFFFFFLKKKETTPADL